MNWVKNAIIWYATCRQTEAHAQQLICILDYYLKFMHVRCFLFSHWIDGISWNWHCAQYLSNNKEYTSAYVYMTFINDTNVGFSRRFHLNSWLAAPRDFKDIFGLIKAEDSMLQIANWRNSQLVFKGTKNNQKKITRNKTLETKKTDDCSHSSTYIR